ACARGAHTAGPAPALRGGRLHHLGLRQPGRRLSDLRRRVRGERHGTAPVRLHVPSQLVGRGGIMTKLIIRRLIISLFILLAVSILVFGATLLLPGDPARAILGQQATEERVAALQAQMNLDQPAIVRYFLWLGGLVTGDLGTSSATGGTVTELLGDRLSASLVLMVLAALISIPLGLAFGIWSALHRGGRRDKGVTWVSLTLAALPEFVIGIALVTIFATSVLQILPAVTMSPPDTPVWAIPSQLILPTITLALVVAPYIARMMRATMID